MHVHISGQERHECVMYLQDQSSQPGLISKCVVSYVALKLIVHDFLTTKTWLLYKIRSCQELKGQRNEIKMGN